MFIVVNRTTDGIISVLDTDDMKVNKFKEYELIRLIESHSIHVAGFYMKQGLQYLTVEGEVCECVNWRCASVYGRVIVPSLALNVYDNKMYSFTGLQQTLLRAVDCSKNKYSKSVLQSFLYDIYQYKINGKDTFMSISLRGKEVWGSFLKDIITNDIVIVHYKNKVIFTDGDLCVFINKESLSPSVNKRGELAKLAVFNSIGTFDPSTRVCLLRDFQDKSLVVKQPLKYKFSGHCIIDKLHIMNTDAVFVFDSVSSRSTINDFYCTDVDICKKFFKNFNIKDKCVCPLGALFYLSNNASANIEIIKTDDISSQYKSLKSDFGRFFSSHKNYSYIIPYREINYFRQVNKNLTNLGYPECINLSDYKLDGDYDFIHDSAKFCNKSNIDEILNTLGLTNKAELYKIFNYYLKDDFTKYMSGYDLASSEYYYKTLIPMSGKKFIDKIMRAYSLQNEIEKLFKLKLTCYYSTLWRSSSFNHICFDIPVSKLPFCSKDSMVEIHKIKDCGILKKVLDSLYGIYITNNKFKCKIYGMERNIVRKESVVTIGILSGDKSELLDIPNLKVKEN